MQLVTWHLTNSFRHVVQTRPCAVHFPLRQRFREELRAQLETRHPQQNSETVTALVTFFKQGIQNFRVAALDAFVRHQGPSRPQQLPLHTSCQLSSERRCDFRKLPVYTHFTSPSYPTPVIFTSISSSMFRSR